MTRFLPAWLLATTILAVAGVTWAQDIPLNGYTKTFSDEFDGPLNVKDHDEGAKWIAHTPYWGDFGDATFGLYTQPVVNPYSISNGVLSLKAWYDTSVPGWRSGMLSSVDTAGRGFAQQFGYFEARMKFPAGQGTWPSFWLLGRGGIRSPKESTPEIDVVEFYGQNPGYSDQNMHVWPDANGTPTHQTWHNTIAFSNLTTAFHIYGALVKPDTTTFYIDGVQVWQQPTPVLAQQPLYMLVNYALGGGSGTSGVGNPSYTDVDWVRVYALPETAGSGQDIGPVGQAGSDSSSAGTYTIKASGSDIYFDSDQFRYVAFPITGDGSITVRVTGITQSDPWAKAGVMMRQSMDPTSPHAFMYLSAGWQTIFQHRDTPAGTSLTTAGPTASLPYWVRLTRSGNTFTGYLSSNGTSWTQIGTQTISMTPTIYIGLAATAHNNSALTTATFDSLSVAPTLAGQEIGQSAAVGSDSKSGTAYTLNASGADIYFDKDACRFLCQPWIGDGTFTARVVSLTNSNAWAKAGIMVRQSVDEKSPNALMCVPAAAQADFQTRSSWAGSTVATLGASIAPPYWVRLKRTGNTFSGYVSPNGINWTSVSSGTVAMTKRVVVGLAATSHNDGTLTTAAFDNISFTSTP